MSDAEPVQQELVDAETVAGDRYRHSIRPGESMSEYTHRMFNQIRAVLAESKERH